MRTTLLLLLLALPAAAQEKSAERLRLEKEAAAALKAQDAGTTCAPWPEAKKATGGFMEARQTAHFRFNGSFTQGQFGELLQIAEAARADYIATWAPPAEKVPAKIEAVLFSDAPPYRRFIRAMYPSDDETKAALEDCTGTYHDEPPMIGTWGDLATMREMVAHMVTHLLMWAQWNHNLDPVWLNEGAAHRVARKLTLRATIACVTFTGEGSDFVTLKDNAVDWDQTLRDQVKAGKDAKIASVLDAKWNGIGPDATLKGWSLTEFLVAKHPAELRAAAAKCADGKPEEFMEALGMTPEELDAAWKKWLTGE